MTQRRLLARIEAYLARAKMAPSRFGRVVAHDPRLVGDLRKGRVPKPENVEAILTFMKANRPKPLRRDNGKQA